MVISCAWSNSVSRELLLVLHAWANVSLRRGHPAVIVELATLQQYNLLVFLTALRKITHGSLVLELVWLRGRTVVAGRDKPNISVEASFSLPTNPSPTLSPFRHLSSTPCTAVSFFSRPVINRL